MPMPRALASAAFAAALPVAASAAHLDYSLEFGFGHSDNINQSATDPVGSNMLVPRIHFDLDQQGAVLAARAVGDVQYIDYLNGDFGNQTLADLDALLDWAILPRRLHFVLEDSASVQPVNVLQPNSPANMQQVNVVSLGPTLQFRLGEALTGQADFRMINSSASKNDEFDSLRELGALRAIRELSPTTTLSANLDAQHVHFTSNQPDSANGGDYDRYNLYGHYHSALAALDVDVSLGYSRLQPDVGASRSSPLFRGTLEWRATPHSRLRADLARRYSDAAEDLGEVDFSRMPAFTSGLLAGDATISSGVYLLRRAEVGYAYAGETFSLAFAPYWQKLDYVYDPTLDESARGASFDASYRPRPLWTVGVSAGSERRSYRTLDRRDDDLRAGFFLAQQLSRHWSWRLDLLRNRRSSTAPLQGFTENVALFTLVFTR
ncbi:MAG: hypothetical protein J0H15_08880 [Xanthomonadales bacterium]|nr:hypothetical protein [Xanthomonadales bacterium]